MNISACIHACAYIAIICVSTIVISIKPHMTQVAPLFLLQNLGEQIGDGHSEKEIQKRTENKFFNVFFLNQ